jgi:secondary thiamine-phosphate synthase enzyme
MKLLQQELRVKTRGKSFLDITSLLQRAVAATELQVGVCTVFVHHTSASLVIQENADPRVLEDLAAWFSELAPESRRWAHDDEGPDDMPAHARSALTRTSETIPIAAGRLALGTWQAVYLWEHRERGHERKLTVSLLGQ